MKKIILFGCFIFLYGVTHAQEQHNWPAAYSNITQHVVGEHVGPVEGIPSFDPTSKIAKSESSILFNRTQEEELLYDNGPVFNETEPELLSILQSASLAMSTYGININMDLGYSMADSFTLDNDAEIATMEFYSYQTGAANPPSIYSIFLQVYDSDPSAGGTVIWGDMTTDRYVESMMTGGFRVLETTLNDTTRKVEVIVAGTDGLSLEAGTYWVEVSLLGMESSGPWGPPITITGEATTGNALQKTPEGWGAWMDSGSDTAQGMPFQVYGTESLGVNDYVQSGLNFYPNPMKDVLNISAKLNIESVKAYNMLGQQVIHSGKLSNGQLDVSSLTAGTYLVKITFEGGVTETFKVLK